MILKKFITYFVIACLLFTSGPSGLYNLNHQQNLESTFSDLVLGQSAHAQLATFTSTAKESNSNFVTYYLPMLVMLGLGVMTLYMMNNLERKTADFYVFAVGSLVYLLSVLTSWTSEKKKFEQLPDSIDTNTQVSALKVQKQSFVDVKEIVERRVTFLGAATAAFAAAAVMAGVAYTKERTVGTQAEQAFQSLVAEVQAKCQQVPLVTAQPPFLDARTMQPLSVTCQRNAQELAQCVSQMQSGQSQLNRMAQQPAFAEGSQVASQQSIQVQNSIIERITECLGPVLSETGNRETAMGPKVILQPEEIHKRMTSYSFEFEIEGQRHVYLPSPLSERYYDPNASYMERYFSDDELAEFTLEEIEVLNQWQPDIRLIDKLIGKAHAQVTRELTRVVGSGDAFSEHGVGTNVREVLRSVASDVLENEDLDAEFRERHLVIVDTTAVAATTGTYIAAERAATAGARRLTSSAAYRQVASAGTRLVATRAGAVLVTTAAVGGAVVSAPVVGAVVTTVAVASAAYELYNITDNYLRATTDRGLGERARDAGERVRGRWNSVRDWWNSYSTPVPKKRSILVDLILPQAHAVLPSLSPAASNVLQNTTESSAREVDRWIFNPKGRMILYGAVAVLTGFITKNAHDLKKKIEQDIEGIDSLIQQMPSDAIEQTSVEIESKDKLRLQHFLPHFLVTQLVDRLIKNAYADEAAGMLPQTVPCLSPLRGQCVGGGDFMRATLIPGVKYPSVVMEAVRTSVQIGNSMQNKRTVSSHVERHVQRLAELEPALVHAHNTAKVAINQIERNKYKAKEIPFDKYEQRLSNSFLDIARKEISKTNEPLDFRRVLGPMMQSNPSNRDEQSTHRNEGSRSAETIRSLTKDEVLEGENQTLSVIQERVPTQFSETFMENEHVTNEGINQEAGRDIFDLISRRYMIWNARREHSDLE